MPVRITLTIDDPPAAPPGYTTLAFEVRSYTGGQMGDAIAMLPGSTSGFEEAAHLLVKAVELSLMEVGKGLRLAAVAWWIDTHLEYCEAGRERLVSVYDAGNDRWGAWVPEEKIGGRVAQSISRPVTTAFSSKFGGYFEKIAASAEQESAEIKARLAGNAGHKSPVGNGRKSRRNQ